MEYLRAPTWALMFALTLGGCSESKSDASGNPDAGDGDGDGTAGDGDTGDGDTGDGDSVWMPRDAGMRGADDSGTDGGGYTEQCTLLAYIRSTGDLPVCAPQTRTCLENCGDTEGCSDTCLDADPSADGDGLDCGGCVFTGQFQCMADSGCATEVNDFMCCFEKDCAVGAVPNCVESRCGGYLQATLECALQKALPCIDPLGAHAADCFPEPDADAGMQ